MSWLFLHLMNVFGGATVTWHDHNESINSCEIVEVKQWWANSVFRWGTLLGIASILNNLWCVVNAVNITWHGHNERIGFC